MPQPTAILPTVLAALTPLFLPGAKGDTPKAEAAAQATIAAYNSQSEGDTISIAQIIAFGLSALGSLALAAGDGASVSTTLQARSNANALCRSEHRSRAARKENARDVEAIRKANPPPIPPLTEEEIEKARQIVAETKAIQAQIDQVRNRRPDQSPAPQPTPPAPQHSQTEGIPVSPETFMELIRDPQKLLATVYTPSPASKLAAHLPAEQPKQLPFSARLQSTVAQAALLGLSPQAQPLPDAGVIQTVSLGGSIEGVDDRAASARNPSQTMTDLQRGFA